MTKKDIVDSPQAKGKRELLKRLDGGHLTTKQAILANCFECCNGYVDGKVDCEIDNCALYEYMPYGKIQYKNATRSHNARLAMENRKGVSQ